jgi:Tfp pilus assembly protein PilF
MGHGSRVELDASSQPLTGEGALGYYSWGSNDPALAPRRAGVVFVPGGLAAWFVGGDARTFTAPPDAWAGGIRGRPDTFYAGGPDALAGDLVRAGATGVGASVADPFLDGAVRPDILFPAYLAGFSLAEAFYLAIPSLSWQTVVLGDPLCRPFAGPRAAAAALDPPLDAVSQFPHEFTTRWLAAMSGPAAEPGSAEREALRLVLRSERRVHQGDHAGAVEALAAAIERAPNLVTPRLQLAQVYDATREWARAAEAYRGVLALRPNNVTALNNLAYLLAERQGDPKEGLALAERAYFASRGEPNVIDTLAWVHHRLGNPAEARRFIREAVARVPDAAEFRYHAAEIEAAAGDVRAARAELDRALALVPALAGRDDVKALLARLPAAR